MSVYVHPLMVCIPNVQWRWTQSTHMVASADGLLRVEAARADSPESLEELHAFAKKIGLKRAWFQDKKLKHYDLNPARFDAAIQAGAILITTREFTERFIRTTRALTNQQPGPAVGSAVDAESGSGKD